LPYSPHALGPQRIHELVSDASARDQVPPGLIRAVLMAESAGDPSALSVAGAQGLMQIMPATARSCGIDNAFDPNENVACGTSYLKTLLDRYHGNATLAVAAYNAGPGAVDRYGGRSAVRRDAELRRARDLGIPQLLADSRPWRP